jgi:hypothetical protein
VAISKNTKNNVENNKKAAKNDAAKCKAFFNILTKNSLSF